MSTITTKNKLIPYALPFELFAKWLDEAKQVKGEKWPNAMTLATATKDGMPSARTILMQRHKVGAIGWYTNYNSRKGCEIEENPRAALLFYWNQLERQVRFEGKVIKASKEESDEYFATRPKESRIASIASQQSQVLEGGLEQLKQEVDQVRSQFVVKNDDKNNSNDDGGDVVLGDVPRPEDRMGMYWLIPSKIEFWQDGEWRLHKRDVYEIVENKTHGDEECLPGWKHYNLYP